MKLKVLSKTQIKDREGKIVTRYGCAILKSNEAHSGEPPLLIQITCHSGEDLDPPRAIDSVFEIV